MEKTKKQIQSEETRSKIIRVTSQLLVKNGYIGTSISEIAKAAGLTKGALYHHFDDKESLVFEVIKSVRRTWSIYVSKRVFKERGAINRLNVLFSAHNQLLKNDSTICLVMSSLISEIEGLSNDFKSEIKRMYNDMLLFIERIIKKGQTKNEIIKDLDTKNTAFIIVGMLRWMGCSPLYKLMDFEHEDTVIAAKKLLLLNIRA